jgi:hypothetical protein
MQDARMIVSRYRFFVTSSLVALAALLLAAADARAQTLLRWKLQPGEKFRVEFSQKSDLETTVGTKPLKMSIDMTMDMNWSVDAVDQQGVAQLTQSFSRLAMKMDIPGTGAIQFDSAAPAPAAGPAKDIAAAVAPLIGAPFVLKMNDRGEILEVKLSDEATKAFEAAAADARLKSVFSKESISETLRQSSAVLPEKPVQMGESWNVVTQTASPLGLVKQASTYTYDGTESRDDRTLEKIKVESTLTLDKQQDPSSPKIVLKEQQQSGTLYFDPAAGRFVDSEITQKLTTETPYREMIIRTKASSTMQMKITPAP